MFKFFVRLFGAQQVNNVYANQEASQKKEGDVTIDHQGKNHKKKYNPNDNGKYIDYEEVE
ncbi:hypothetical protein OAO55_03090 [Bacteroidales bacterium]|nr:hypothetical protein [Bacteroidales bacterium]